MQAMQETWGYLGIMLRILAAESLVLAVSSAVLLETTELWVTFGTCKHLKTFLLLTLQHWAVRRPVQSLCSMPSRVEIQSHRLQAEGKRIFDICKSFNEVTPVFSTLSTTPLSFNERVFVSVLETYVVLRYDRKYVCLNLAQDTGS